jgi:hypothetical protein
MKNLKPLFSAAKTKWPARNASMLTWNASCRRAASRAAEILPPLPDLRGVLPVQAPIAAVATENSLRGHIVSVAQIMSHSNIQQFNHLII